MEAHHTITELKVRCRMFFFPHWCTFIEKDTAPDCINAWVALAVIWGWRCVFKLFIGTLTKHSHWVWVPEKGLSLSANGEHAGCQWEINNREQEKYMWMMSRWINSIGFCERYGFKTGKHCQGSFYCMITWGVGIYFVLRQHRSTLCMTAAVWSQPPPLYPFSSVYPYVWKSSQDRVTCPSPNKEVTHLIPRFSQSAASQSCATEQLPRGW